EEAEPRRQGPPRAVAGDGADVPRRRDGVRLPVDGIVGRKRLPASACQRRPFIEEGCLAIAEITDHPSGCRTRPIFRSSFGVVLPRATRSTGTRHTIANSTRVSHFASQIEQAKR